MKKYIKDPLGFRMKENYENRTRYYLPRRTYTIIRLDQKAAHTYTSKFNKPFDHWYMDNMVSSVMEIIPEIQGMVFAYLQSDEVNILLTDFNTVQTDAWFGGNVQKMASISASILTAHFNKKERKDVLKPAYFDSRVFSIPDRIEVMNIFRWRQQDCIRNSLSMVAQHYFSQKELNGKKRSDMHEMLYEKNINWTTDYSDSEKNGTIIYKENNEWISQGAWIFSRDQGKLLNMIPEYPK